MADRQQTSIKHMMLQSQYEGHYKDTPVNKIQRLPIGSVIIEKFTSWVLNETTYFEVYTAGQSITYALDRQMTFSDKGFYTGYRDGFILYTLDKHGNPLKPSVFRKPITKNHYLITVEDSKPPTHNINMHSHFVSAYSEHEAKQRMDEERPELRFRKTLSIKNITP